MNQESVMKTNAGASGSFAYKALESGDHSIYIQATSPSWFGSSSKKTVLFSSITRNLTITKKDDIKRVDLEFEVTDSNADPHEHDPNEQLSGHLPVQIVKMTKG